MTYVVSAMAQTAALPTIARHHPSTPGMPTMKHLLLAALVAASATSAWAAYPDKPITIVVPFAAGGPTDKVARDLAEALRKPLPNATIVIDNTGGAGGTL